MLNIILLAISLIRDNCNSNMILFVIIYEYNIYSYSYSSYNHGDDANHCSCACSIMYSGKQHADIIDCTDINDIKCGRGHTLDP